MYYLRNRAGFLFFDLTKACAWIGRNFQLLSFDFEENVSKWS